MFNNTSGLVLMAAMASAGAYAAPAAESRDDPRAGLVSASADIRNAQVELYCDHRYHAIAAIRRATHALEATPRAVDPVVLAALEEAVWEARRDHTGEAVAALDTAMLRLGA